MCLRIGDVARREKIGDVDTGVAGEPGSEQRIESFEHVDVRSAGCRVVMMGDWSFFRSRERREGVCVGAVADMMEASLRRRDSAESVRCSARRSASTAEGAGAVGDGSGEMLDTVVAAV